MISTEEEQGKTSTEEEDDGERNMERQMKEKSVKLREEEGGVSDLELVGDPGEVASFEDLLQLVGTRGPWNLFIFIVCCSSNFMSVLQVMSYQFLGATPDHWCYVATLVEANWTQEQILASAIPYNNQTGEHDSCQMYKYDYEDVAELGYEGAVAAGLIPLADNTSVLHCNSRDFNLTQYDSTVTIQWDLVCERRVLYATTQVAVYVGQLLGYFISGYLLDRFGRRPVVLWSSILFVVSGFVTSASPGIEIYIFLRAVTLTVASSISLGCFVIIMETCSVQDRSMVGTMSVLPWALGFMALPGVAYLVRRWQWLQAALTLPSILFGLYYWLLPESSRWLILQGRYDEALEILRWGARVNRKTLPPDHDLRVAMEKMRPTGAEREEEEEEGQDTVCQRVVSVLRQLAALVSTQELRQRTLLMFFCWFAASMVYYGVALNSINLSVNPYIYTSLGGLLEVPSYLILWVAIVFLGRVKTLSLLYLVSALSILLLTTTILLLPEAPVAARMFLSLCGKVAITAAFQLIYMFTTELYPTKYRSMAVGQASVLATFGSISSSYINDILGELDVWAPSAVFGLTSLVGAGLSLLLPETKELNLPEENKIHNDPHQQLITTVAHGSGTHSYGATEISCGSGTKENPDGHCNVAYDSQTEEER